MEYCFYMDKILCPVAPSKLNLKIKGQNKTANLINEDEINILKKAGLTDISFELLLPNVEYPFATYKSEFQGAEYFLSEFERLKGERKPFQFIVTRTLPNGDSLFDTNMKVSLENYDIVEDSKNGLDVVVSIKLKQFKEYGTKICNINFANTKPTLSVQGTRSTESSPAPSVSTTYTVQKDDTLSKIAKMFYGDSSKYVAIFEANKDKISNPNLIYPGWVLTIPDVATADVFYQEEQEKVAQETAQKDAQIETVVVEDASAKSSSTKVTAYKLTVKVRCERSHLYALLPFEDGIAKVSVDTGAYDGYACETDSIPFERTVIDGTAVTIRPKNHKNFPLTKVCIRINNKSVYYEGKNVFGFYDALKFTVNEDTIVDVAYD